MTYWSGTSTSGWASAGDRRSFGMQYVIPTVVEHQSTIVAINVGGAAIPVLLSVHLLAQCHLDCVSLDSIRCQKYPPNIFLTFSGD